MKTSIILLLISVLLLFCLRSCGPGGDGILAELVTPDGTHCLVTQRFNGILGEPYTVDFWVRKGNTPWRWCYLAHEDMRWFGAALQYEPSNRLVRVFRGSSMKADLDLSNDMYSTYHEGIARGWGAPLETNKRPDFPNITFDTGGAMSAAASR